jgi:hypothetical protein
LRVRLRRDEKKTKRGSEKPVDHDSALPNCCFVFARTAAIDRLADDCGNYL